MRFYSFPLSGVLLLGSFQATAASKCNPNKCDANNCYRQVVASAFTTRHNSADCSSFLATTITPSTVTISRTVSAPQTVTVTNTETVDFTILTTQTDIQTATAISTDIITDVVTETVTVQPTLSSAFQIAPRVVTGLPGLSSAVPPYASSCTSPGQYASACSCIGILPSTVTAPTPSTTVTVTISPTVTLTESATISIGTTQAITTLLTVTTTEVISKSVTASETVQITASAAPTVPCQDGPPTFVLQVDPLHYVTEGSDDGLRYMEVSFTDISNAVQFTWDSDVTPAHLLDIPCSNLGEDCGASIPRDSTFSEAYLPTDDQGIADDLIGLLCSIDSVSSSLSCTTGFGVAGGFQLQGSSVFFSTSGGGMPITLTAITVISSCPS